MVFLHPLFNRLLGGRCSTIICPTDYPDVLTVEGGEIAIDRMHLGLVTRWGKGTKSEVRKKFDIISMRGEERL